MGGSGSGKPKGELLTLDGRELIDGKLEKTEFFSFLATDLSDYSDITMTPEQALAFKNSIVRMTHGVSAAIPLWCAGSECFNKLCSFHKEKNYPYGRQCYFETRMIQVLTRSYIEDIDANIDSPTEMTLINQLVEADIIDFRANIGLSGATDSEAGQLLKTNRIESEHGVAETTNLHPLLDAKDRANNKRVKILEALVSTRREKYKQAAALKQTNEEDSSQWLAKMKEMINSKKKPNKLEKIEKAALDTSEAIDADWSLGGGEK